MAYNQIPVACTGENAPFQQFDLWWISQFTSRGIDMPCETMGTVLLATVVVIACSFMVAGIVINHYMTRDRRNPLDVMARRNRRNRCARQKAARIRVNTARREEKARNLRWSREDRRLERWFSPRNSNRRLQKYFA